MKSTITIFGIVLFIIVINFVTFKIGVNRGEKEATSKIPTYYIHGYKKGAEKGAIITAIEVMETLCSGLRATSKECTGLQKEAALLGVMHVRKITDEDIMKEFETPPEPTPTPEPQGKGIKL